jgi:hypothetical protein
MEKRGEGRRERGGGEGKVTSFILLERTMEMTIASFSLP